MSWELSGRLAQSFGIFWIWVRGWYVLAAAPTQSANHQWRRNLQLPRSGKVHIKGGSQTLVMASDWLNVRSLAILVGLFNRLWSCSSAKVRSTTESACHPLCLYSVSSQHRNIDWVKSIRLQCTNSECMRHWLTDFLLPPSRPFSQRSWRVSDVMTCSGHLGLDSSSRCVGSTGTNDNYNPSYLASGCPYSRRLTETRLHPMFIGWNTSSFSIRVCGTGHQ